MISFLEFVAERLMGPPIGARSWRCPFHDDGNPSFAVNPPKQRPDGSQHPIKFRCHAGSCGRWGDEWDLVAHFYPGTFAQHKKRMRAWELAYERLYGINPNSSKGPYPPPGQRGSDAELLAFCCSELRSVIRDRGLKWSESEAGFRVLLWADRIAADNGIPLDALVRRAATELIGGMK